MKGKKQAKTTLLLLRDVVNLGRKGELAKAKPGFVRNFLLPQKWAVIADARTIRWQERLQKEREEQAITDRKDAEILSLRLKDLLLEITVKNDPQGHLYGSVSAADVVHLLAQQGNIVIERRQVVLPKPLKMVGLYEIPLKLKEGVPALVHLCINGEVATERKERFIEVEEEVDYMEENSIEEEEQDES